MVNPLRKERDIQFIGHQKNHSIVIGNYGDAKITADGIFDLAGLVFCPNSRVEMNFLGEGRIKFSGTCKELVIQQVLGNCHIDLSDFSCKTVRYVDVKGKSTIILGKTRSVELISIDDQSVISYIEPPAIVNQALLNVA